MNWVLRFSVLVLLVVWCLGEGCEVLMMVLHFGQAFCCLSTETWLSFPHLFYCCFYQRSVFFEKITDLSLLIFSLETYRFCMKCIEFTTRTYNLKNLAVGSLIWSSKTGVNSSYFPQKISTCHVLCCILKLSASRVAWAYLELL